MNKRTKGTFNIGDECWKVRTFGLEAIALGQLFSFQQGGTVLDENALAGVGALLEQMGRRLMTAAARIEEADLRKVRRLP
jgi:hypothetical protein